MLCDKSPESLDATIDVIQQINAALAIAHHNGVIHRDLKPENVIITNDGKVKLMDFGLARTASSQLSAEGELEGTVNYISPEQAMGQPVDGRTDLYALGVMFYELVTGQLPFQGETLEVISQHINKPVTPPRKINPQLPTELEDIILKLLAKKPEDRYASSNQLATALDGFLTEKQPHPGIAYQELPIEVTSFIGRQAVIEEVTGALSDSRLVTLIGPGGSGKTRLALRVAKQLIPAYPDGVVWVELVSLEDPNLIPQTVAGVMKVIDQGGEMPLKSLTSHLRDISPLLILDNCEHLIEASAKFSDHLLRTCPRLYILATSREALGIDGENTYEVPPMRVPYDGESLSLEDLAAFESIQLFTNRAKSVLPDFELSEATATHVYQICRQLDGIPLAIELAAARVKMLTVSQIVGRLDDRFRLLTSGKRTALPHHQTLRAMIDWSYGLLAEGEQILFNRLAVFSGGWTLEAAEQVCSGDGINEMNVLDLLTQLMEKSMIYVDRSMWKEPRYRFLETIRQYASEKLSAAGEIEELKDRHLAYYLQLVEYANPKLAGSEQTIWLNRMEADHDNLRAALEWSTCKDSGENLSLKIAIPLGEFWKYRGFITEGRKRLRAVLDCQDADVVSLERGEVLDKAATLAYYQGDYDESHSLWAEGLQTYKKLGDGGKQGEAFALTGLANTATEGGNYESASRLFEQALVIMREIGDTSGTANTIRNLGWAAMRPGDYIKARERLEEALMLYRQLDDKNGIASCLSGLGEVAVRVGDYDQAKTYLEESLQLRNELKHKWGIGATLGTLGWMALRQEDYNQVRVYLGESLAVRREISDKGGIAWCLEKLAESAWLEKAPERSARLFAAAAAIRKSIDSVIDPADQPEYDRILQLLGEEMGEDAFQAAWEEGNSMALDSVIKLALETD